MLLPCFEHAFNTFYTKIIHSIINLTSGVFPLFLSVHFIFFIYIIITFVYIYDNTIRVHHALGFGFTLASIFGPYRVYAKQIHVLGIIYYYIVLSFCSGKLCNFLCRLVSKIKYFIIIYYV